MSFDLCVVGLGYIGLPTAALAAHRGLEVLGCDLRSEWLHAIERGQVSMHEPGFEALLKESQASGRFHLSVRPKPASIFLIAVPTPVNAEHAPDMGAVFAAFDSIVALLKKEDLVILESTCPVGTTEVLRQQLSLRRADLVGPEGLVVDIVYAPERILPGRMIEELDLNPRIIGADSDRAFKKAEQFYQRFLRASIRQASSKTAEMVKLCENAYRDVNIAFANMLSMVCEREHIDVWNVIEQANQHPRVNILSPGPGVGGHCIAVDPWFLIHAYPEDTQLLKEARDTNDRKCSWAYESIVRALQEHSEDRILCMGLTYKANTDDCRESPALHIVSRLLGSGYTVDVCDPMLDSLPEELSHYERISFKKNIQNAFEEAHVIALLVDHTLFEPLKSLENSGKHLIDTRGFFRP